MQPAPRLRQPRLVMIVVRTLIVTLLFTLLSFAVSLLAGIVGLVIYSRTRGVPAQLDVAYRNIAAPFALVMALIVLVLSLVLEIRNYRQAKALSSIERAG